MCTLPQKRGATGCTEGLFLLLTVFGRRHSGVLYQVRRITCNQHQLEILHLYLVTPLVVENCETAGLLCPLSVGCFQDGHVKYFPWTCETLVYQVTDSGSDVVLIDSKTDFGLMSCCKITLKRVL